MDDGSLLSFARLVERVDPDARLITARPLKGGVSADVAMLELVYGSDRRCRWTVRRHGPNDLASNPRVASDEYALLRVLVSQGIKVPEPLYVDDTCDLFPTPVIVIEFVDGDTVFEPLDRAEFTRQAASELKRIHDGVEIDEVSFLPHLGSGIAPPSSPLDESLREEEIRAALELAWPLQPVNPPVLLHGDYWPGNLLWRDEQLVAVIDWEDARIGDPLADLGNARLEMLYFFGEDGIGTFTNHYLENSTVDVSNLPYWDLRAALRPCGKLHTFGLAPDLEQAMRERHSAFVDATLRQLAG